MFEKDLQQIQYNMAKRYAVISFLQQPCFWGSRSSLYIYIRAEMVYSCDNDVVSGKAIVMFHWLAAIFAAKQTDEQTKAQRKKAQDKKQRDDKKARDSQKK
jgi:hypothetical protein